MAAATRPGGGGGGGGGEGKGDAGTKGTGGSSGGVIGSRELAEVLNNERKLVLLELKQGTLTLTHVAVGRKWMGGGDWGGWGTGSSHGQGCGGGNLQRTQPRSRAPAPAT